jgi:hypothetical protein
MHRLKIMLYMFAFYLPALGFAQTNSTDSSCLFKVGSFLRYRSIDRQGGGNRLDAYVVSCERGYYKIVTRKYVPGEKTLFAQNKNIPHYMLSQSTSHRANIEKEFVLNEDYKAGKKIIACARCGGTGAEYYAEQLVNGKTQSVNVTHIMSTLSSNVVVIKSSCSKCYGHGWKVQ